MNSRGVGIVTALLIMTGTVLQTSAMACEPAGPSASGTQQKGERTAIAKCGPEIPPSVTDERSRQVAAAKSKKFADTKNAKDIWAEAKQAEAGGNYAHAARLYRGLARQGHGLAAVRLGEMYATGAGNVSTGVPRDLTESRHWYEQARENGEKVPARP
jgi:TPR repeat protein